MKVKRDSDNVWVVCLERGDDVRTCVEGLAADEGVGGARLQAIGVLEDPELGSYELDDKIYHRKTFDGRWELASFLGNISMLDGKPFMHAHVGISGHDFEMKGGHLFEAKVGVVMELFFERLAGPVPRIPCEEIGLALWEPTSALS